MGVRGLFLAFCFLQAALVLFRTLTGGEWQLILWDTVDPALGGGWWAYVYWISFNFFVVIIMLKLFVLVIVDEFLRQDMQMRNRSEEQLSSFQLAWSHYDPRGTGFIRVDDLHQLLLKLPAPLGLPPGCSFSGYLSFCDTLKLMTWQGYVNYHDVLLALHRVTYGVGMPLAVLEGVPTASHKIHDRVTRKLQRLHRNAKAVIMVRNALQHSAFRFIVPPSWVSSSSKNIGPIEPGALNDSIAGSSGPSPVALRTSSHPPPAALHGRSSLRSILPSHRKTTASSDAARSLMSLPWLASSPGVIEVCKRLAWTFCCVVSC